MRPFIKVEETEGSFSILHASTVFCINNLNDDALTLVDRFHLTGIFCDNKPFRPVRLEGGIARFRFASWSTGQNGCQSAVVPDQGTLALGIPDPIRGRKHTTGGVIRSTQSSDLWLPHLPVLANALDFFAR